MDVLRLPILFFALIGLTGCAGIFGDASKVFDEPGYDQKASECAALKIEGDYIVEWHDGRVTYEKARDRDELIQKFVEPNLPLIKRVEENHRMKPMNFKTQMVAPSAVFSEFANENWGQTRVQANVAWTNGVTGAGVIIAVVDTGVDVKHPQLKNQIYTNMAEANGAPGVDDDGNGYVDDVHGWNFSNNSPDQQDLAGHGTHVAGIIAADHSVGSVKGMAPGAKILPVDFMKPVDQGSTEESGTTADAIKAVQYAAANGAQIINASWGSGECSKALKNAVADLGSKNVLFVAAAGNERLNIDKTPRYPAAYDFTHQITVGASTPEDVRAGFSNWGQHVHVVAPGKDIWSTWPGSQKAMLDGTSMAAPFVAGQAALILSANPQLKASELKTAIMNSVQVGSAGAYVVLTKGEIRVKVQ